MNGMKSLEIAGQYYMVPAPIVEHILKLKEQIVALEETVKTVYGAGITVGKNLMESRIKEKDEYILELGSQICNCGP